MQPGSVLTIALSFLVLTAGNSLAAGTDSLSLSSMQKIPVAAAPGSREPRLLLAGDGKVYLSWLEPVTGKRYAFRFSTRDGNGWSQPRTIAEGENWFVNWADYPALASFPDGSLAALWRVKNGGATFYSYDIHVAFSRDGGQTWSAPMVPHRDGTKTQHGFASALPWRNDRVLLVWLDGRRTSITAGASEDARSPVDDMTLRVAAVDSNGRLSEERLLDRRVCTCCQTASALTSEGVVVVYRDRSETEIRDISIIRYRRGRWSDPRPVQEDGWQIDGCPINGPAVAARGERVAVAWFTAAHDSPRVQVAFSNDGGESFDAAIAVAGSRALGRTDITLLPDDSALVTWLELTPRGEAIRFRRVRPGGLVERAVTLSSASSGRTSGFPRIVRDGHDVYFAWTQPGKPLTIRTAVLKIAAPR